MYNISTMADIICKQCKKKFKGKPHRKYCGRDCSGRSQVRTFTENQMLEMVKLYNENDYTLRQIGKHFNVNHHKVRSILGEQGVKITRRNRLYEFSDEHRRKISKASKGRPGVWKGKTLSRDHRIKNITARLSDIDVTPYKDLDRFVFLSALYSKRKPYYEAAKVSRQMFLEKFYYDAVFNKLYDLWTLAEKCKWHRPTLDHKTPISKGGGWTLDNLQIMTWFENRAKADMTQREWEQFRTKNNTMSDLFLRIKDDI